jgi:transcriptional regulator NrdR family protein
MYVIKRDGRKEKFSGVKLFKSVHNACLSAEMDDKTAKKISKEIMGEVQKLAKGKKEVKSNVIFDRVKKLLARHNKECAFMYETYRDVS